MAQKVGDIKTVPYTFVTNNGQKVEAELGSLSLHGLGQPETARQFSPPGGIKREGLIP
jgi:hypothetical protein